jgi:hypothetical protein
MNWWHLISYFFGGAFLANAIPHVITGMTGRPFKALLPSRRVRDSPPQPSTWCGALSISLSPTS